MYSSKGIFDIKGSFKTTAAIEGIKAVYINSASKLALADTTDVICSKALIGISTGTIFSNTYGKIIIIGEIYNDKWNWDVTKPVLLGVNGELTQIAPTEGFIKIMGLPLAATLLLVKPEASIILI